MSDRFWSVYREVSAVTRIRSSVPHIAWPALPSRQASDLLALQFQLERSQWLSPHELLVNQMQQVGQVLSHAYRRVPFYRSRLDPLRLSERRHLEFEDWRAIPVLKREELQKHYADLCASDIPVEHQPAKAIVTSGSTGRPVQVLVTDVTRRMWKAITLRDHLWHRRDMSGRQAVIRSLNVEGAADGLELPNWGSAVAAVFRTGPSFMLDVHASIEEQATWLERVRPTCLLTYPSNALALAKYFRRNHLSLESLNEVRTLGEVVEQEVRIACRDAWGVKVADMYSAQEVGYLALQCPLSDHYHVQSESVLVEVLNDNGTATPPGSVGRVVVTSLHNFATPLIRYEIGDYAEVGTPCECGRGLPVLSRILGRSRNMAVAPDGTRRWPALELTGGPELQELPPVEQFQLIQLTRETGELRLVVTRPLTSDEEMLVQAWTIQALGFPLDLKLTYLSEIPRSPSGKFEDFRCDIDVDLDSP